MPFVDLDGQNWPAEFAAKHLGIPELLLREAIKYAELEPAGVIRMSEFRRQGRQPKAYPAGKLIMISEALIDLKERLAAALFPERADRS